MGVGKDLTNSPTARSEIAHCSAARLDFSNAPTELVIRSICLRGRVKIPTGGYSPRATSGATRAEQDSVEFRGRQSEERQLVTP